MTPAYTYFIIINNNNHDVFHVLFRDYKLFKELVLRCCSLFIFFYGQGYYGGRLELEIILTS